jgi:AbrB family looped-hinge helix DNA binding protein
MAKVDSKGRIVLPKELRDRLGLDPGTEIDVREEDGRAVVEPEESAEELIADLERRIADAASRREQRSYDELDPTARDHVDTIQRQASDSRTDRDAETTDE